MFLFENVYYSVPPHNCVRSAIVIILTNMEQSFQILYVHKLVLIWFEGNGVIE